MTAAPIPDPGTEEAAALGCTCPIIDNHYGSGYRGDGGRFQISECCPVHRPAPKRDGSGGAMALLDADQSRPDIPSNARLLSPSRLLDALKKAQQP